MTQDECDELWNQLISDERSCVSMYKVCGVEAEAARHIDKTPKWLDNRQRTKSAFRRTLDSVGQWPLEDIDRRQNVEIYSSASVFLRRVIESDDHHGLSPISVWTSNVFAILGLRALFFLVARVLPYFR